MNLHGARENNYCALFYKNIESYLFFTTYLSFE
jgi:hypothetical protein